MKQGNIWKETKLLKPLAESNSLTSGRKGEGGEIKEHAERNLSLT